MKYIKIFLLDKINQEINQEKKLFNLFLKQAIREQVLLKIQHHTEYNLHSLLLLSDVQKNILLVYLLLQ